MSITPSTSISRPCNAITVRSGCAYRPGGSATAHRVSTPPRAAETNDPVTYVEPGFADDGEGWSAGGVLIGSPILTAGEFVAGLAITLIASELMARGLTRLGTKAGFSEGLLGLLGALLALLRFAWHTENEYLIPATEVARLDRERRRIRNEAIAAGATA